jgi:hypothetical protein
LNDIDDDTEPEGNELKHAGYEIFVGILSILSIVNIALLYAIDDANLDTVLTAMNSLPFAQAKILGGG